ncbi:MAG: LemA family protein [Pseudomonadota bacterium]
MGKDRVSTIIQRVYARKYNLAPAYEIVPARRNYLAWSRPIIGTIRQKRLQILVFILVVAFIAVNIYYYNLLVTTQQDVLSARGKVSALEQRRNDISINLSKSVYDYSRHERSVFTAVVTVRSLLSEKGVKSPEVEELIREFKSHGTPVPGTGAGTLAGMSPGSAPDGTPVPGKGAGRLAGMLPGSAPDRTPVPGKGAGMLAGTLPALGLDRLLAVAEQYPDLKLAANFQSLMAALVEVEKDLSMERVKYNDAVNTYTTNLAKFPIKFVGRIFDFKEIPYFEATEDARRFRPIDY